MGAFDRICRMAAKKSYQGYRPKAKAYKRNTPREVKHRLHQYNAIKLKGTAGSVPSDQLQFGSGVKMMLKFETDGLLQQKKPCTLYDLAVALLAAKRELTAAVQIDQNFEEDPKEGLIERLAQIQLSPRSQITRINSWEEAQEALEKQGGIILLDEDSSEQERDRKSLETFKVMVSKATQTLARKLHIKNFRIRMMPLQQIAFHRRAGEEVQALEAAEEAAYQEQIHPKPQVEKEAELDQQEEAHAIASKLLRPLSEEEHDIVQQAIYGQGPPGQIVAQLDTDIVIRESMQRLQPGEWLNDEVIHYFMVMLAKRDEALCKKNPLRRRSHFFKSFFITKLLNEGHADPSIDGTYDYRNVKRWSKKVPGKDIFGLDKVVVPINQGGVHWVCAVIYIQEKRIEMYDSLGGSGKNYLKTLFRYLQDEHLDKKKCSLPDLEEWKLVPTQGDTPKQKNGE
jgi:sentrin-specific protease 1